MSNQIGLLFKDETIRALSWNQPYASLMLHGKIETRNRATNVRGKVLICSCQKAYPFEKAIAISGNRHIDRIFDTLEGWPTEHSLPTGQAIAIGELVDCRPMTKEDEERCFVQYREGLWCWIFENVQAIKPFPFKGKQGWSILGPEIINQIKFKS